MPKVKAHIYTGFKISALRQIEGISRADIREVCEITPTYLSMIERGEKIPSVKVIKNLNGLFKRDCAVSEADKDAIHNVLVNHSHEAILIAAQVIQQRLKDQTMDWSSHD